MRPCFYFENKTNGVRKVLGNLFSGLSAYYGPMTHPRAKNDASSNNCPCVGTLIFDRRNGQKQSFGGFLKVIDSALLNSTCVATT